jgi:hypothetical protein
MPRFSHIFAVSTGQLLPAKTQVPLMAVRRCGGSNPMLLWGLGVDGIAKKLASSLVV